ncbi:MAG: hypothetical protein LBC56_04835 [Oscillospiraceae bacterium]|nr:hypothetical protein [Oscillospiraceae bacterium]
MDKINRYAMCSLRPDEVYIFNVALCDNQIDRDFERFSIAALYKMAELFLGKTGIKDHDARSVNQVARIFDTRVVQEGGYARLEASAYMVKNAETAPFIDFIEGGINKEVSVSLAVKKAICSICGKNCIESRCEHTPGENGAYLTLDEPADAYEWSFVAVPAQRNAGVVKSFRSPRSPSPGQDCERLLDECRKILNKYQKELY